MRPREKAARQPFAFTKQPEQQVLGLDRWRPELAGFVSRVEENSPRPLCVLFKHRFDPSSCPPAQRAPHISSVTPVSGIILAKAPVKINSGRAVRRVAAKSRCGSRRVRS